MKNKDIEIALESLEMIEKKVNGVDDENESKAFLEKLIKHVVENVLCENGRKIYNEALANKDWEKSDVDSNILSVLTVVPLDKYKTPQMVKEEYSNNIFIVLDELDGVEMYDWIFDRISDTTFELFKSNNKI